MSTATGRHPRMPTTRFLTTRELLVCAALGGLTAMMVVILGPAMAAIATLSPPLYALVSGYSAIAPLLALRIIGRRGAATVTALCCGLIAWPFSALGVLLLIALIAPAVAMDAVYMLRARIGERTVLWAGAAAAALTIFALSIPVISPEQLTPIVVMLTLLGRLASYAMACGLSALIARALTRAGVRRFARQGVPGRDGRAGAASDI